MNNDSNGGFTINVNSPGNLIAQTINFNAPVTFGGKTEHGGFSDQQIARALEACVGRERVINTKWKWAGAYWYLRWACNYPVDVQKFCTKIQSLELTIPGGYECSYESIRKLATLSFMDCDARKLDEVKVSRSDQDTFAQCREIVLKLAEELGKSYLPKV
jgi:hypothetical protein